MNKNEQAKKVLNILEKEHPNSKIALNFKTPLQLIVATILSAQCADERVNKITPTLFKKFKTADDFADSNLKDLEDIIKPTGFYKN